MTQGPGPKTPFHIASLDGIRALAFGCVFFAHAFGLPLGMLGVTVFFFLSGFLITTLMRREYEATGDFSLRRFYTKRFLRILPPLYLSIAAIALLTRTGALGVEFDPGSYWAGIAFYLNYWTIFGPHTAIALSPLWSLAVEEHFYLLFPLLFVIMIRRGISVRRQAWILSAISAGMLGWRLWLGLHTPMDNPVHLLFSSDTRIDSILFGAILALAANPMLDPGVRPSRGWSAAAVAVLALPFFVHSMYFKTTLNYTLQGLAFMPLFTLVICRGGDWFRWLNGRGISYLGALSYTMYLVHVSLVQVGLRWLHSRWTVVPFALTATILFAAAVHTGVERPLARIRRRLDTPGPAVDTEELAAGA